MRFLRTGDIIPTSNVCHVESEPSTEKAAAARIISMLGHRARLNKEEIILIEGDKLSKDVLSAFSEEVTFMKADSSITNEQVIKDLIIDLSNKTLSWGRIEFRDGNYYAIGI
jgi:hypothetical protein